MTVLASIRQRGCGGTFRISGAKERHTSLDGGFRMESRETGLGGRRQQTAVAPRCNAQMNVGARSHPWRRTDSGHRQAACRSSMLFRGAVQSQAPEPRPAMRSGHMPGLPSTCRSTIGRNGTLGVRARALCMPASDLGQRHRSHSPRAAPHDGCDPDLALESDRHDPRRALYTAHGRNGVRGPTLPSSTI